MHAKAASVFVQRERAHQSTQMSPLPSLLMLLMLLLSLMLLLLLWLLQLLPPLLLCHASITLHSLT